MTHGEEPEDVESVGKVLQRHLMRQVVQLREQEARVREDEDSAVHKMRIAVRRLRSALATYRPALAPGSTDRLREELRWLGGELSPARDAQVLRERLLSLLREQPAELVMGPVESRIRAEMSARYRDGRVRALASLDDDRYRCLLSTLDTFVVAPPFVDAAHRPAREELPRLLRRDLRRVRRRAEAVLASESPTSRDLALHDTRKAAKRLRYAAESAVPVLDGRARKLAKRAKRVQEVLGEHQDAVVARAALRELGVQAYLERENGFTFGRLHALEEVRAQELVSRYPGVLDRLPSKRLHRWLSR